MSGHDKGYEIYSHNKGCEIRQGKGIAGAEGRYFTVKMWHVNRDLMKKMRQQVFCACIHGNTVLFLPESRDLDHMMNFPAVKYTILSRCVHSFIPSFIS